MKFTGHIKTGDYEFLQFELDGSAEDAVAAYKELQDAWKGEDGTGITHKDWCRFLDTYLSTGSPPEDGMSLWQDMNSEQKRVVNECKKTLARLSRKSV